MSPTLGSSNARLITCACLLCACAALCACKTDEGATRPDPSTPTATTQPLADTSDNGLLSKVFPSLPRAPLAMPPAGEARAQVSGCAQGGQGDDQDGDRFPAKPAGSRAATGQTQPNTSPDVHVSVLGDGVRIQHDLDHTCCLKANVDVRVTSNAVYIQEVLSGSPCRCRCQSTLEAAVGLPLGDYTLTIETVTPGGSTIAHRQHIQVKPLLPRAPAKADTSDKPSDAEPTP